MNHVREYHSPGYNYIYDRVSGLFIRWGDTLQDDPEYAPPGPEILDIEVSTICSMGCPWCYKGNTGQGENMSLDTFRLILDRMPTITQVAFGIGDIDANPDLWKMMAYCRSKLVVPNITVNGYRLAEDHIEKLALLCGAVAVSNYNLDTCLRQVHLLRYNGANQVNIHQLLAQETLRETWDLIRTEDSRRELVNAIVLLSVKRKGRGVGYTPVSQDDFTALINHCLENDIRVGFDSCGAHKFIEVVKDRPDFCRMQMLIEPCESGLFSSYVDVHGFYHPCSFAEGEVPSIPVLEYDDFERVWYHPYTVAWRGRLIENGRHCPLFEV